MICEMCGKENKTFFKAKIEGSEMTVCAGCARYASEKKPLRKSMPTKKNERHNHKRQETYEEDRTERIQIIASGYAKLIKEARERRGLKQEELAKKLAEKESLLQALESGKHKPSMNMARKLERMLGITLVIEHEESHEKSGPKKKSGPLTIGDLIKQ